MSVIFPLLFLFLCAYCLRPYVENWRAALLSAMVVTAVVVTVLTEGLSLLKLFSFFPLLVCWLLLTVAAAWKAFNMRRKALWPEINLKTFLLSEKILAGIIFFIAVESAITAAVGIPNTWDSMTYHLPRIEHWIQDRTVDFYPTNIIRQLYITPWAEYAMAHLSILGGGLTGVNFIQWMSMAGSLIGVSLIAGQLGAGRLGQLLAATMAACLPTGILQSVSTQTDYAGAFWLMACVYFLVANEFKFTITQTIFAGLSLGLAFLTKGNNYIFALPFLIVFISLTFKRQLSQGFLVLVVMGICVAGLNMGQYLRNAQAFGSPLWTSVSLANESFDVKVLWVNVLRNASIQLATPLMNINESMKDEMVKAAQFLGADINDPRASFGDDFSIHSMSLDEDYAGNFFEAIIFAIVLGLSWFYRGPEGRTVVYSTAVLASFLIFCLTVRYQPWNSRFHLPLFILFAPVAGVVLARILKQGSVILGIFLFLTCLPWLFLNTQHPWFGGLSIWEQPKPAQYFYKRPALAMPYAVIAAHLKSVDCNQIGLLTDENTWEYPWWVLLAGHGLRIEHVGVTNLSASLKYPLGEFHPCAVIASGVQPLPAIQVGGGTYAPVGAVPAGDDKITIYVRKF
jgi:hypothetical protein